MPARDDQTESDAAGLQLSYKQILQPQGIAGSHVMSVTKSSVATTRTHDASDAATSGMQVERRGDRASRAEQVNRARALQ